MAEKYDVKKVGIFGSVRRGEHGPKSDVDVLVEFSKPISFFEFIRLEGFLSKKLGRKVDLISKKAIKSAIRKSVLKETIYI